MLRAGEGSRTPDLTITNRLLWPTELLRQDLRTVDPVVGCEAYPDRLSVPRGARAESRLRRRDRVDGDEEDLARFGAVDAEEVGVASVVGGVVLYLAGFAATVGGMVVAVAARVENDGAVPKAPRLALDPVETPLLILDDEVEAVVLAQGRRTTGKRSTRAPRTRASVRSPMVFVWSGMSGASHTPETRRLACI